MNGKTGYNYIFQDVIGLLSDEYDKPTIIGLLKKILKHLHGTPKVFPDKSDAVTITSGSGTWVTGDFVEIIPSNAIPDHFDIHFVNAFDASANDIYQLDFYKGLVGNEVKIGSMQIERTSVISSLQPTSFMTELLNENERVSAKLSTKEASIKTIDVSVCYHEY